MAAETEGGAGELTYLWELVEGESEFQDGFEISGPCQLSGALVDSCGDHRIAMALALVALGGAPITIAGAECVAKSYPEFWDDLAALGARISAVK